jgi:hypothetical protein
MAIRLHAAVLLDMHIEAESRTGGWWRFFKSTDGNLHIMDVELYSRNMQH